eukprot:2135292-Lingulodinium_polyedra.AAC.1
MWSILLVPRAPRCVTALPGTLVMPHLAQMRWIAAAASASAPSRGCRRSTLKSPPTITLFPGGGTSLSLAKTSSLAAGGR